MTQLLKAFNKIRIVVSNPLGDVMARAMSSDTYEYKTLQVSQHKENVWHVQLNRPDKLNTFNLQLFRDVISCFKKLSSESLCRSIILSGAGRHFTAGIDIGSLMEISQSIDSDDPARRAFMLREFIKLSQDTTSALEECYKPVIAAIHNACIGAGIDLTSAADIRYCSKDAFFQIKEVDVGLAADMGTLQRFPKVVGNDSLARELIYTGRKFDAEEAKQIGYVSKIFSDKDATFEGAVETASLIAEKSPIAVQGSKINLVYSRDHSVPEGLHHMITWNSAMLQSEDTLKAGMAFIEKTKAVYSKL